jgi:hypothetical protein
MKHADPGMEVGELDEVDRLFGKHLADSVPDFTSIRYRLEFLEFNFRIESMVGDPAKRYIQPVHGSARHKADYKSAFFGGNLKEPRQVAVHSTLKSEFSSKSYKYCGNG